MAREYFQLGGIVGQNSTSSRHVQTAAAKKFQEFFLQAFQSILRFSTLVRFVETISSWIVHILYNYTDYIVL